MDIKNEILLRRSLKYIAIPNTGQPAPQNYAATILKNIENTGYTFSQDLLNIINTFNLDQLTEFYYEIIPVLNKLRGADRVYAPMYPNFPDQVMNAEESELYINAILHYVYGILPEYNKLQRLPLIDNTKLSIITLGTDNDYDKLFIDLMSSKTSISSTDKKDLVSYFKNDDFQLPSKFYHKEVQSFVYSTLLNLKLDMTYITMKLSENINTVTDVLRLAVSLSDGDESLATNTKFRNFKRSERRMLLSLMNNCPPRIEEDMLRYKGMWIRLGEKLHPGDYKKQYPKVFYAFDVIRNDSSSLITTNFVIENFLKHGDVESVVQVLKGRPGEFARRLDHLFRLCEDSGILTSYVVKEFKSVVNKVSSTVLLQVASHFENRCNDNDLRVVMPKGNVAKLQVLPNNLSKLDEQLCDDIVHICEGALLTQYNVRESIGNVYIDDALNDIIIPFSQRSASEASRTITRGSRFKLEDDKSIVRFFIWWRNTEHARVDLDLSAMLYDENWNYKEHISYTNLRSTGEYEGCHSGDITDAPNKEGAAEFIDINIKQAANYGGRYIVMNVLSYINQPFNDIECTAGWMLRDEINSGEIFEPRTVQNRFTPTGPHKISVPLIIDIVENKVIWSDITLNKINNMPINVENNNGSISLMCKAIEEMVKPSLGKLFKLHFEARGIELVDDPKDADTIFSIDKIKTNGKCITPFDIETIMNEYL